MSTTAPTTRPALGRTLADLGAARIHPQPAPQIDLPSVALAVLKHELDRSRAEAARLAADLAASRAALAQISRAIAESRDPKLSRLAIELYASLGN